MPNWCFNALDVEGDSAELERLCAAVASEESALDFERIDPTPPELQGTQSDLAALACGRARRPRGGR